MPTDDRTRRAAIGSAAAGLALLATLCLAGPGLAQLSGEPVVMGVSGPLTGPAAQYGAQWRKGFDLALDQINASGGIDGRPLEYVFEDSQNDPRQSVAIAQKFVADPNIVVELGDFSSTSSMAASAIYQRGGLVQFGFTNSHPDFTKGGDYMWTPSISQAEEQPLLADYAVGELGFKRIGILHLNTDWGTTAKNLFVEAAKARGAEVVAEEGYLPDEKDFRSTLVRVRSAEPDSIVLESYYPDGAQIVRQMRTLGIDLPIASVGSVYSPKFLELGGDAVNGVHTTSSFFPSSPRPEVQAFVSAFRDKYGEDPDAFSAFAYDAVIILATVMREFGTGRDDIKEGLAKVEDVPSVIFGKASFDPETRRVAEPQSVWLIVEDGAFAMYQQ
jgi:branched-chain amino acid transport system substrate-binding protein